MRNDDINHPKHYAGCPASIECIDITRHLNFQLGNAVKYIWRAGKKGGLEKEIEDLKKAEWYLGDQCDAPGPDGNEGIARIIFSLIPRRAFDSPLRHSLIEDVLYGRFDEACESLEAWIAKAEKGGRKCESLTCPSRARAVSKRKRKRKRGRYREREWARLGARVGVGEGEIDRA
jgi:hypothetical protein